MIGFTKIYVDINAEPTKEITCWVADAFVVFGFVIFIGKIRHESEIK